MAQAPNKIKKIWKWIGGIFLLFLLLLGSFALYFSLRWKPLLAGKIKEGVDQASRHLYKVDFKDIHLNLLTGSAALDGLTLVPDTAVFRELKRQGKAPMHLFELQIGRLQIRRVGVLKAWLHKEIDISSILLDKPSIRMIRYGVPVKKDATTNKQNLYELLSKSLKSIQVDQVRVQDADMAYLSGASGKKLHEVKKLNIKVQDLLLDARSEQDSSRVYGAKDISFELAGYHARTKDNMYTLKADSLSGSVNKGTLMLKDFRMVPMYPELAFSRKYKTQKDRYDLHFQRLEMKGLDFSGFNLEGSLHAGLLKAGPAKVNVFMNRELPPVGFDKGKNYPQLALRRLALPLTIDTVLLQHIDVAYTEYNPIAQKKGTVELGNLQGRILNVTNDSLQLLHKNHALATLNTRVLNAAALFVKIDFKLDSKNADFHYQGHIGAMDMKALNPLAESLGLVKIEQGQVQKADFDVQANLKGSRGKMNFYYTALKVALLKETEEGAAPKKKGFLSFLANKLVIKDANPSKGEKVRTAEIRFERTPAASFFNLLWKSVFTGIRETVGIGMVPVKSPEKAYEKVKDKKQERKEKQH
ncbi:AsmA family protein [Pedobacter nutrimenti]|uniref:AsmA-like protein n=1 Tax=Pedobacter nutrimenti TaxID=1241337 RepID=A0A318UPK9_9SPHI|nr:hypothetical protein [Pedobacter nutrimenti]PYF76035.1 hypothetical protein B0O44_102591 [Pedobacter nutrimenti]